MFGGRLNRLTASLIRRIRAKFLAQIKQEEKMVHKILVASTLNPTIFKHELSINYLVEDDEYFSKEFVQEVVDALNEVGVRSCIYKLESAKNTEQANQPDSQ